MGIPGMDMSFQEKSILGSLVITVCLFGAYFIQVFKVFTADSSDAVVTLPIALIGIVIAVVVVEIIYQITIALVSRDEGEDERDRLIEANATRFSYYILATGSITAVGYMLISGFVGDSVAEVSFQTLIAAANMIIFSFILAEVVGFAMQLYYYRRGV